MSVKSAARVLDIFELLAEKNSGLNVSQISAQLGFPLSSTHALLNTLTSRDYLIVEPNNLIYRLGSRMFEVGNQYVESQSVVDVAQTTMRQMRKICDETISLGIYDGRDGIILVRKNESSRTLRIGNPLGTRLSIYSSAMGKAILATWPEEEVITLLKEAPDKKIRLKSAFLHILDEVRDSDIAFDIEESTEGVCAIAAALDTGATRSSASLAIVVPVVRAHGKEWERLPTLLIKGANAIVDCIHNKKGCHDPLLSSDFSYA